MVSRETVAGIRFILFIVFGTMLFNLGGGNLRTLITGILGLILTAIWHADEEKATKQHKEEKRQLQKKIEALENELREEKEKGLKERDEVDLEEAREWFRGLKARRALGEDI